MKKQLCLVGPFILCFRTRSAGFVKRFQSESNQRVVSGQGNQGAPPPGGGGHAGLLAPLEGTRHRDAVNYSFRRQMILTVQSYLSPGLRIVLFPSAVMLQSYKG